MNRRITEVQSYTDLEEALKDASSLLKSFVAAGQDPDPDRDDWGPVEYSEDEAMYFGWSDIDGEAYDIFVIDEKKFKTPRMWGSTATR